MTRAQRKKVAKIWSLSLIVHCSEQVEDDPIKNGIRHLAGIVASSKLEKLGFTAGKLLTMQNCIDAVTR